MSFPRLRLGLDVHVVLEGFGVLLGAVPQGFLPTVDLLVSDVGVVDLSFPLDVQVAGSSELEWDSVPGANVQVEPAVLVRFLADARLHELVGDGACLLLQVL